MTRRQRWCKAHTSPFSGTDQERVRALPLPLPHAVCARRGWAYGDGGTGVFFDEMRGGFSDVLVNFHLPGGGEGNMHFCFAYDCIKHHNLEYALCILSALPDSLRYLKAE